MQELTELTGDDLRTARKQLGMSQRVFADALGAGRRTVEDWEADISKPPRFLRLAIAALVAGLPAWPLDRARTKTDEEVANELVAFTRVNMIRDE